MVGRFRAARSGIPEQRSRLTASPEWPRLWDWASTEGEGQSSPSAPAASRQVVKAKASASIRRPALRTATSGNTVR
jgi:hypothetical protein